MPFKDLSRKFSVAVVDMTGETEGEIMDSFQRWP
jgi:hypothetical protein